jgi:4-hydroxy-tetrahydrodipicolinate synthase
MQAPSDRSRRYGLSCAIATPFAGDGSVDLPRLKAHATWCLEEGCRSITLFGTTGEGASIGASERRRVLDGLATDLRGRLIGGVFASAPEDAAEQIRDLLRRDAFAILLTPPFYFKGVQEDGLFAWFAQVFDRAGGDLRDIILYNLPALTHVPITNSLVRRLRESHPEVVTGVKDSSGDWETTAAYLREQADLAILVGDERQLARAVREGADGSICGLANLAPRRMARLVEQGVDDEGIARLVGDIVARPVVPAIKALIAHRTGNSAWNAVRAPLAPLALDDARELTAQAADVLAEIGA